MTWRRLYHFVANLPADSATVRAQLGDAGQWSFTEHLLVTVLDTLNVANWQRSAKKGSRPPKPIQRPGTVPSTPQRAERSFTPDEFDALRASIRREEES